MGVERGRKCDVLGQARRGCDGVKRGKGKGLRGRRPRFRNGSVKL